MSWFLQGAHRERGFSVRMSSRDALEVDTWERERKEAGLGRG